MVGIISFILSDCASKSNIEIFISGKECSFYWGDVYLCWIIVAIMEK